jgi:hypothetical protein
MKKRLIKAITNGELEDIKIEVTPQDGENMEKLKSLDSAEVRTGTCPKCEYSPLEDQEGYKICKNCGTAYKIFNDETYVVF